MFEVKGILFNTKFYEYGDKVVIELTDGITAGKLDYCSEEYLYIKDSIGFGRGHFNQDVAIDKYMQDRIKGTEDMAIPHGRVRDVISVEEYWQLPRRLY